MLVPCHVSGSTTHCYYIVGSRVTFICDIDSSVSDVASEITFYNNGTPVNVDQSGVRYSFGVGSAHLVIDNVGTKWNNTLVQCGVSGLTPESGLTLHVPR